VAQARFWLVALAGAVVAAVVSGLPTVMFPNPFFVRMTPVRPLDYVFWLASAALLGPLLASYVVPGAVGPLGARRGAACPVRPVPANGDGGAQRAAAGGLLSVFAVGCPVCNKLVVLALGAGGALTWFAPLQPVLGAVAVALLAFTLRARLRALGVTGPAALRPGATGG
jgi:hypothetical protein